MRMVLELPLVHNVPYNAESATEEVAVTLLLAVSLLT